MFTEMLPRIDNGFVFKTRESIPSATRHPAKTAGGKQPDHAGLRLEIVTHAGDIAQAWDQLEDSGCASVYQRRAFISAWLDSVASDKNIEPAIACLYRGRSLIFVLPLVVSRRAGLRIAEFTGATHSNHNLPLVDAERAGLQPAQITDMLASLARRLRIDAFELLRQPLVWNGQTNPIPAAIGGVQSTTIAQDVFLDEGFDTLLKRHNGASKRKKLRAKERIFAAVGGYEVIWARNAADCHVLLEAFFQQKSLQFAAKGIHNVFAEAETQDFFRRMADYRGDKPVFELAALSSQGVIRAVRGYGLHGDRLSLMMQSYTDDDLSRASPGETLLFRSFEEFCQRGFKRVDFGVGRERYKDSWADAEMPLIDSLLGCTLKGKAYVLLRRGRLSVESAIRNNPRLFKAFKSARRLLRGRQPVVAGAESDNDA